MCRNTPVECGSGLKHFGHDLAHNMCATSHKYLNSVDKTLMLVVCCRFWKDRIWCCKHHLDRSFYDKRPASQNVSEAYEYARLIMYEVYVGCTYTTGRIRGVFGCFWAGAGHFGRYHRLRRPCNGCYKGEKGGPIPPNGRSAGSLFKGKPSWPGATPHNGTHGTNPRKGIDAGWATERWYPMCIAVRWFVLKGAAQP